MSYCRFGEADVYVFTTKDGIECCFCSLQKREWVDDPTYTLFKGYFKRVGEIIQNTFKSNAEMITHLRIHQEKGDYVPDYVFDQLSDPKDEAENQKIWNEGRKLS